MSLAIKWLTILAFGLTSCGDPGFAEGRRSTAVALIPGTKVSVPQILFAPGHNSKIPMLAASEWKLCRRTKTPPGTNAGAMSFVVGDVQSLHFAGKGQACNADIGQFPDDGEKYWYFEGCGWNSPYGTLSKTHIKLVVTEFTSNNVAKCFARMKLYLRGYQGALTIPDSAIFVAVADSPWRNYAKMPEFVPIFQFILGRCETKILAIRDRNEAAKSVSLSC